MIVVYKPRVYLIEIKAKIYFFSWKTNYYFVIGSYIHAFYFVNNVAAYKALLLEGKGGKLVYKMFIVKAVSMHLLAI